MAKDRNRGDYDDTEPTSDNDMVGQNDEEFGEVAELDEEGDTGMDQDIEER